MTDILKTIKEAMPLDQASFRAFLTDELHAVQKSEHVYELPEGGTVTFREGGIDVELPDGQRMLGNVSPQ